MQMYRIGAAFTVLIICMLIFVLYKFNIQNSLGYRYNDSTKSALANMIVVVQLYHSDKGKLPTESEGIDLLVTEGYLSGTEPKLDPWGSEYIYRLTGNTVEIRSLGENRKFEITNGDDLFETKLIE